VQFTQPASQEAEWTILTFIQANNDLAPLAYYSISHMQAGMQSTNGINVLVQWVQPQSNTMLRYKITPGDMTLVGSVQREEPFNQINVVVDSMRWAQIEFPAKKYMLIFWNHGTGILDYGPTKSLNLSDRGRFKSSPVPVDVTKGILLDDTAHAMMTNQDLLDALTQIKNNLGKKIDIVVMDACFMAMLEVGYQIKDTVDYYLASQEAPSSNEGLPYSTFLYTLSMCGGKLEPVALAQTMVQWYDLFHRNKKDFQDYTFSAVDLTKLDKVKQNVDLLVSAVQACAALDTLATHALVAQARSKSHEFFWVDYMDLYSFYEQLLKSIDEKKKLESAVAGEYLNALDVLKSVVISGLNVLGKVIIANCYGLQHHGSHGMSVYYPAKGLIEGSYEKTLFAQNSEWMKFVMEYR